MKRQFLQLKEQLGWQGTSGIVMLLLAGAFNFLALQPVEREVEYMHSRLDAVQSKTEQHGRLFGLEDRQRELEIFFDSLPEEEDVTDILASVAAIAEASQIELKQADYRLAEKGKHQIEYEVAFPVKGGYANIRHFVFRTLADHQAMALDKINFQRDKANDSILKAEVRLTLFLQKN